MLDMDILYVTYHDSHATISGPQIDSNDIASIRTLESPIGGIRKSGGAASKHAIHVHVHVHVHA